MKITNLMDEENFTRLLKSLLETIKADERNITHFAEDIIDEVWDKANQKGPDVEDDSGLWRDVDYDIKPWEALNGQGQTITLCAHFKRTPDADGALDEDTGEVYVYDAVDYLTFD